MHQLFLCTENPQLGWGFRKAFSFESVIKTPFDLLKQFAVWQLQMFNKKSKGVPMRDEKSLAHTRWNCKYHIVLRRSTEGRCFTGKNAERLAVF